MIVFQIDNLSRSFKTPQGATFKVLDDISLQVSKNEFVSLIGPSGCGKSTHLDYISMITPLKSSYMMQNDVMLPWRNVLDNIILPLEIEGIKKDKAVSKINPLVNLFGLEKFVKFYPDQLSGGMKQRASLLRCYASERELVLLDEPFGKLDAINRIKMQEWFLNIWQKKKLTVLMVTHDIQEAIFLSDRIYILSKAPGRVVKKIVIPFKRPRSNKTLISPDFYALKSKIMQYLHL